MELNKNLSKLIFEEFEDAVKYGVKHIDYSILGSVYQKDHNVTTLDFTSKLEDTIQNGVKLKN